jgi:hypothetical protein
MNILVKFGTLWDIQKMIEIYIQHNNLKENLYFFANRKSEAIKIKNTIKSLSNYLPMKSYP